MKKKLVFILLATVMLTGCGKTEMKVETEHMEMKGKLETYCIKGCRYFTNGDVVLPNGEVYVYHTEKVSEIKAYDNMPVWVGFDDNGTNAKNDDIILGLVYDRETAIYDSLYESFSEVEDALLKGKLKHRNISVKDGRLFYI